MLATEVTGNMILSFTFLASVFPVWIFFSFLPSFCDKVGRGHQFSEKREGRTSKSVCCVVGECGNVQYKLRQLINQCGVQCCIRVDSTQSSLLCVVLFWDDLLLYWGQPVLSYTWSARPSPRPCYLSNFPSELISPLSICEAMIPLLSSPHWSFIVYYLFPFPRSISRFFTLYMFVGFFGCWSLFQILFIYLV